jgi:hypothetical protein
MLLRNQQDLGLDADETSGDDGALERVQRDLRFVAQTVTAILDGLPIQRRPLAESTKALHVRVTWLRRNGYCPCCQQADVCGVDGKLPGAEFDHWYGRSRNRPEETWLVCRDCNRQLENTDFKAAMRSAFESYQLAVRPFLGGRRAQQDLFEVVE